MIKLDYSLESTDWIKRGTLDLPTDRKRLEAILGLPKAGADRQARLEQLWMLPIWESLPDDLRAEFNEPFTKGDFEGHPFRGNQWVDANGVSRAGAGSTPDQDRQAYELRQQGKTWEEIARELGYANGGAVRRLAMRHEKRLKDGVVIPPTPDKPAAEEEEKDGAGTTRIKDLADPSAARAALKELRKSFPDGVVTKLQSLYREGQFASLEPREREALAGLLKVGALVDQAVQAEIAREFGFSPEEGRTLMANLKQLKEAQAFLRKQTTAATVELVRASDKAVTGTVEPDWIAGKKVLEVLGLVQASNAKGDEGINPDFLNFRGQARLPLRGDIPEELADVISSGSRRTIDRSLLTMNDIRGLQVFDAAKSIELTQTLVRDFGRQVNEGLMTVERLQRVFADPAQARKAVLAAAEEQYTQSFSVDGAYVAVSVTRNRLTGEYSWKLREPQSDASIVRAVRERMESQENQRDQRSFRALTAAGATSVVTKLVTDALQNKKVSAALNGAANSGKLLKSMIDGKVITADDTARSIDAKVREISGYFSVGDKRTADPLDHALNRQARQTATRNVLEAMGIKFASPSDVSVTKAGLTYTSSEPINAEEQRLHDQVVTFLPKNLVTGTALFYKNNEGNSPPVKVALKRTTGRAHAQNSGDTVTIGMQKPRMADDPHWKSVYLHELGHGVEYRNPFLRYAEALLFESRRGSEEPQTLRSITGNKGYSYDEKAIKDEWANPYAGKIYGGGHRQATHEIFTTGLQNVWFNDEVADDEHRQFIFAILAAAGNL
jgi:hypothetical protein